MILRLSLLLLSTSFTVSTNADETGTFESQVAPTLRQRCIKCHNPKRARGELDITSRNALLKGGKSGPAIVVGKPEKSLLLKMISGVKPKMPRGGEPLSSQQIASIKKWIQQGANWPRNVALMKNETWWSLRPLTRPELPKIEKAKWAKNPVDLFVLARHQEKNLTHSAPASRATLLRRLTYDLHGLPPTPEDIQAFVSDDSPNAYGKVVDRLLASPRYGERWGRHWLDVAHYADTHGYDKDKRRDHAWPYRDYVIRAFNQDKPYSRFVKEQLAGDYLYPQHRDGIIATGFLAAGPWDFVGHRELREGTVEKMKTRLLDRDDIVSSVISTFNSMTVHCARCHNHKFDPIPQKDYYRLQAVFSGIDRGNRKYDSPEILARRMELISGQKQVQDQLNTITTKIRNLRSPALNQIRNELSQSQKLLTSLPRPMGQKPSRTNGYHSHITKKPNVTKWVQVDLGMEMQIDQIRLIPARPVDFPDTPGFGFPVRFQVAIANDPKFIKADLIADHCDRDYPNPGDSMVTFAVKKKRARFVRVTANKLWLRRNDYALAFAELQVIANEQNVARGATVTSLDSIEAGRWSRRHLVDNYDSRKELADLSDPTVINAVKKRTELIRRMEQLRSKEQVTIQKMLTEKERHSLLEGNQRLKLISRELESLPQSSMVYAVNPREPRPIWVLKRGDVERHDEKVKPGALSCVPDLSSELVVDKSLPEGARRAALAKWITDHENVLTWRSIANRIWHYHFGQGLVRTPNDFGENGALPTHPELLDWLATELRDNGGSIKSLHRLIVMSATWQQSSTYNPEMAKVDNDNQYLWRVNRRRLDAESIRDSVLAVSGQLSTQMAGPGFTLFRFKDDHSPVYDYVDTERIHDPATYRRTIYRFTVRSVPNPFLECLDSADPNVPVPVRNTTLTAQQALALLNNPFMVRQAEFFAHRVQKETSNPERQIQRATWLAFGRSPRTDELRLMLNYRKQHGLVNLCRLLLNANELVFVD